ncbi:sorcin-like [Mizuhopecten yessoensis]|uniref:sorcin-like n=1 Tax=Mizuhopecten yessoensis TaxID=6573 RepID=UPI000B45ADB7|nr:sorcin-like [Mizuhopecten yessoensis]
MAYYQQNYSHYQQPSQHYGQYGQVLQQNAFQSNVWQAFGFSSPDELQVLFNRAVHANPQNVQRQAIQAEDLVKVMNESQQIRQFFGICWSRELCKVMLAMLDRSKDGFMQWNEFMELQQCLVAWFNMFRGHDVDRNNKADANELLTMIANQFKFKLTPNSATTLLKRYSYVESNGACVLSFDDFVTLCVKLRALTDAFRRRDQQQHGQETGNATFNYDDFLQCTMCL